MIRVHAVYAFTGDTNPHETESMTLAVDLANSLGRDAYVITRVYSPDAWLQDAYVSYEAANQ